MRFRTFTRKLFSNHCDGVWMDLFLTMEKYYFLLYDCMLYDHGPCGSYIYHNSNTIVNAVTFVQSL